MIYYSRLKWERKGTLFFFLIQSELLQKCIEICIMVKEV